MRIFLTGATGFIGSHIVTELLGSGHAVLGLTRSEAGAQSLRRQGAEPHAGDIEDLESLARGAAVCDAVIHTAFDHDFTRYVENCEKDRRVVAALGRALAGTDRPLLITSSTGMGSPTPGALATEDQFNPGDPSPRVASELAGEALTAEGVKVIVIRLPQVHDTVRQGLISYLLDVARQRGVAAWVGDGANCYSAAHVSDVARLYRLALERGRAGARYHAVAERGVSLRVIAETLASGLGVPAAPISPESAADHFGPMAAFAQLDLPASSAWTRAQLDWTPTGLDLITDLQAMDYTRPGRGD